MIHIDTSEAIKQLKALNKGLSEKQSNRAIALAFNATLSKQRTAIGRHIRKKYPASALKAGGYSGGKGIIIERANSKRLYAKLSISNKRIPLIYFRTKQMPNGVQVEVEKKKRHLLPFAFYAKGKMKKRGLMAKGRYKSKGGFQVRRKRIRTSGSDLPITQLVGPRVNTPDPSAMYLARENATKEVVQQLGRFFDKIAGGIVK